MITISKLRGSGYAMVLIVLAAGCAATDATSEPDAAPDAAQSDGGAGGDAGAAGATCEALHGPTMVEVLTPGGIRYCIDSTEVTQGQYQGFVLYGPSAEAGSEHERCADNESYQPAIQTGSVGEDKCFPESWTPDATPNWPVGCIDWCDALAYCKWAGKRLCGKVGGGEESEGDREDANGSQWYNACTQGGTTVYPYGDEFDPSACNGAALSTDPNTPLEPSDVGTWPGCRGTSPPWSNIYDTSGSVLEWTDSCEYVPSPAGGGDWSCAPRGGGFLTYIPSAFRCDDAGLAGIGHTHKTIGFRCCKDLE